MIIAGRRSDVDSLLIRSFQPIKTDICKEHALPSRVSLSKSVVCPVCIQTAKTREELAGSIDNLKLLFTLITHTAILDSDSKQLIGYLAQDHQCIFRFDTGKWQ